MKNKKQVTLYSSLALPILVVLILGGYIAYKTPAIRNTVRQEVKDMMKSKEEGEKEKPNLDGTQKITLSESEINALISTKISDYDYGGRKLKSATITIDGENNIIKGVAEEESGAKLEFTAKPLIDKAGVEITSIEVAGKENKLFEILKNPLKTILQKAINKAIEEKAENLKYIELKGKELIIYVTGNINKSDLQES